MATAARFCEFCSKIIDDKSYRSLTSNTSQENYKEVFELLCLSELKGFCCNLCINKLNAISRLNKDMKTKLITTKRKLDQIVSTVQNLPGVKKYMSSVGNIPEGQLSSVMEPTITCYHDGTSHNITSSQGQSQIITSSSQGPSQNIQTVQAALYTSQNVNPKVPIQRLKPRSQVPSWAKNALHLEHFVMPKKIKMITGTPNGTFSQPPLVQNFVRPAVIPQLIIKTEPLMPASQITTYSDFTSHSWSVVTSSASTATPGQTVIQTWSPAQQEGTISSVTTPVVQSGTGSPIKKEPCSYPHNMLTNDLQTIERHEDQMDNSNKKIKDQQCIAYLQNTLKKKDNLLHRKKLKTQNVDDSKNSHSFEQLCCNKQLFRHYTGYTPEEFQLLFRFLIPDLISGPYRSRGHNLSVRTQLLMTLCKLRNNFTFIDLGHRFHVSKVVVKNIFCCWLNHMSEKFDNVYIWPHRDTLKAQLPRHFQQDFPSTLSLFKCVKIKVSQISCDNLLGKDSKRNLCDGIIADNSLGKDSSRNVRHGIIAVDPRGCVIGCSGLVGEVYTSSELFRKSGLKSHLMRLLNNGRLKKDDGILCENFDIGADLEEIGLKLNDVAFSKCDIDDDLKSIIQKQRVQTHKVLVDKAVCRFKKFQIVSHVIPQSLSSSSDKIFQVTAFLTNFLPPISLDIS